MLWEGSKNQFGRPKKKGRQNFGKFFENPPPPPPRENPRSAPEVMVYLLTNISFLWRKFFALKCEIKKLHAKKPALEKLKIYKLFYFFLQYVRELKIAENIIDHSRNVFIRLSTFFQISKHHFKLPLYRFFKLISFVIENFQNKINPIREKLSIYIFSAEKSKSSNLKIQIHLRNHFFFHFCAC